MTNENIHKLASLRYLKLNLEYQNTEMEENFRRCIFSMRLCSKSTSCNRIPQLLLLVAVFYFKTTTLMISIFGHKTLHCQLRIVIPSGL